MQPVFEKQHKDPTLFAISLQNDDVQDFDVRWDHALIFASEMPSDLIQERLYRSKLETFVQRQTCDGIVRSRNGANQGAELTHIEDSCGTSC